MKRSSLKNQLHFNSNHVSREEAVVVECDASESRKQMIVPMNDESKSVKCGEKTKNEYQEKLAEELKLWEELLQNYKTRSEAAQRDVRSRIEVSTKEVSEVNSKQLIVRQSFAPIDFALGMKPVCRKKIQLEASRNKKLVAELMHYKKILCRLREIAKFQKHFFVTAVKAELQLRNEKLRETMICLKKAVKKYALLKRR
ncbi:unnamed protein product [Thelazia callipaeda]|uniref:DUF632 domain-containing protein n=1 Tax=Thelazia callipaeda TaxID=103827 RepID=A0A0N5CK61_THECL|nr:unnamed protein product [Thelazia callipaeda]